MTRRLAVTATFAAMATLSASADSVPVQGESVSVTGCLRSGSAPAVFILRGAAEVGDRSASGPRGGFPEDYLVVSSPEGVSLNDLVNRRLEVSGSATDPNGPPPAPQGANAAERALKRLTAKSVKEVAANCSK